MTLPANWTISEVRQKRYHELFFDVYFSINEVEYAVRVQSMFGFFKPRFVIHTHLGYENCVACQQKAEYGSVCDSFEPFIVDLFHALIDMPSIRLHWLFLNHV